MTVTGQPSSSSCTISESVNRQLSTQCRMRTSAADVSASNFAQKTLPKGILDLFAPLLDHSAHFLRSEMRFNSIRISNYTPSIDLSELSGRRLAVLLTSSVRRICTGTAIYYDECWRRLQWRVVVCVRVCEPLGLRACVLTHRCP